MNKVYNLDSRQLDKVIKKEIIDVTITSPPYHDLKDYGCKNQIGFGQAYNGYLDDLENVFQKVYSKTKSTGTLWVIIDAYRKDKEVIALPFDFAKKLQRVGWKFKNIIIWSKDRTVPWAHSGQMRKMFEFILVFSKTNKYKFYLNRVRETENLKNWWIKYPERYNPKGKAPEEIWSYPIPTQGSWGNGYISHFCPLPEELVRKIILLTTNEKDVVFDPFAGSGMVPAQAYFTRRKFLGFELNPKYIRMFENYLEKNKKSKRRKYDIEKKAKSYSKNKELPIIDLRVLKYARILIGKFPRKILRIYCEKTNDKDLPPNKLINAIYHIQVGPKTDKEKFKKEISINCNRPPLAKYGIQSRFRLYNSKDGLSRQLPKNGFYCYRKENTHLYFDRTTKTGLKKEHMILSKIKVNIDEKKEKKQKG